MSALSSDGRHLDRAGLSQYLAAGAPAILKIEGSPDLYLIIDPTMQTLRLRAPQANNTLPDVSQYRNLAAQIIHWQAAQWCQLSISGPIIVDAYPILLAIADRIQNQGAEFGAATRAVLDAYREILTAGRGLSEESEVGLFGEMLLLLHLLKGADVSNAIEAWRGHAAEEHDFSLSECDLEVKTTTSESRLHWINSLTQLQPTVGRSLWLASLQITTAGAEGRTLSDLIGEVEAATPEPLRGVLRLKLAEVGWRDVTSLAHSRRFHLRTRPALYQVADGFPTLTPEMLASVGAGAAIAQVRYMVDLSHVTNAGVMPVHLVDFVSGTN